MLEEPLERAIALRRELESIPVLDTRDAERKRALLAQSDALLAQLRTVADVVVGAALATASQGGEAYNDYLYSAVADIEAALDPGRDPEEREVRLGDLAMRADWWLNEEKPDGAPDRQCLHWPLAFPEVFLDASRSAGFDAIIGNPPFLGGKRISGVMGDAFRQYLVDYLANGRKGHADLVVYFVLRCSEIARGVGILATNSIAQGDSREVGLGNILGSENWMIYRAVKSRPWPGAASLEVAQIWMKRGQWYGDRLLSGLRTKGITSSLDRASRVGGSPESLSDNKDLVFNGSYVLGMGFVLSPEEARSISERSSKNSEIIFPYLNGSDLNSSPDQRASRYVINFFDWPEDKASSYAECWDIILEKVRPERQRRKPDGAYALRNPLPQTYWIYAEKRPALYGAISDMHRVLAIAATSKVVQPAFVPTDQVFSHATYVFAYDDDFHFGVLSSSFHWWWAVTHASTLETRIRYTPTDCFETFPQPEYSAVVEATGKALDDHRRPLMIANNEGLTKTYNRVHDPDEQDEGIIRLRELHRELDIAVRDAYGWDDLDLDHGFHETSQGIRYTIGPDARVEVLDRLLELNHARYAEEVAQGLHNKKKGKSRTRKRSGKRKSTPATGLALWPANDDTQEEGDEP